MAKEYIEREAAIRIIKEYGKIAIDVGEPFLDPINDIVAISKYIANIPAADVVEVVHGRWEDSIDKWFEMDIYTCSKCRESYVLVEGTPKENLWHYCPNCGAKMDGGE